MKSHRLRRVNRVNSGPPDHHQGTCAFPVCRLHNDITRPRFNRAFSDSWNDTWLPKETPMKIGRAKNHETWDGGPSKSRNPDNMRYLHHKT